MDGLDVEVLDVEVCYAEAGTQWRVPLRLPPGATVAQAVAASGLQQRFPELVNLEGRVGVFGRPGSPQDPLMPGDRVEIYRPLLNDPKASRRDRVRQARRRRG